MTLRGEERQALTFEKGLNESQEDSLLEIGHAAVLENWIPEPNGCLRCRRGWVNTSTTGAPATRRVRGIGRFAVDNTTGDVSVKVGSFAKRTSAGSQSVAGVGFQPKAIIFFGAGPTASGFLASMWQFTGFTTGTAQSFCVATSAQNGVGTPNSSSRMAAKCITIVQYGESLRAEADLTSFDAGGFTLNWTTSDAVADIINYIAIGGADLTNAKAVNWTIPSSVTNKSVTGVGFQPSLVLHSMDGGGFASSALPRSLAGTNFSIGAMDSSGNQWANAFYMNDKSTPDTSDTGRAQVTSGCLLEVGGVPSIVARTSYVSMDSDGFTVNQAVASGTANQAISLCLKVSSIGRVKVGSFNKDTGAAPDPQSVTGVGFTPKGLLLSSWGRPANAAGQVHAVWGMGGVSAVGSEKSVFVRSEDALATSDIQGYQNDFPLSIPDEVAASTLDAQFDFTTFDADGFTGSWTTNDADADEVLYLAFGGGAGAGVDRILVAQNDTTNFDIYSLTATQLTTGTWTAIDSNITVSDPLPAVDFASGLGQALYTHKKFSTIRAWNGSAASAVAGSPPGRTISFHKNRFFVGGTEANPTRLWYTDLASHTSWPATNFIDVGKDDGEAIEDTAPFEDGLLIAKRNSLWFLSGSGPDTFALHPLNGGGGYTGRCIVTSPFGAVIAGARQVWLWTGGGVDVTSTNVQESYSMTGDFVSTGYIDGVIYILDEATGTQYCLNIENGSWWLEKQGSPTTEGPAILGTLADTLLYGPQNATSISLLAYRQIPGTARARDALLSETFQVWTPEMWLQGVEAAVTPKHLHVRIRQRGGDATGANLTITPYLDGVAQTAKTISPRNGGAQVFRERLDIGARKRSFSVQFRVSLALTSAMASLMDIEEMVLEYDVEEVA